MENKMENYYNRLKRELEELKCSKCNGDGFDVVIKSDVPKKVICRFCGGSGIINKNRSDNQ
jgi:DnaJ-class molecular chaperone